MSPVLRRDCRQEYFMQSAARISCTSNILCELFLCAALRCEAIRLKSDGAMLYCTVQYSLFARTNSESNTAITVAAYVTTILAQGRAKDVVCADH
jgi:hypothetical protein